MDAFFASVEENDNPKLKGHPVIVGGLSNHGIVTTANYEARKYGVHSAMPIFIAKKKCPHGIYILPRMNRYREVSATIMDILYEITEIVEPLSIDEAYLDISDVERKPLDLAYNIKEEVMKKTGLTLSVGISYNKFLAKLASDWNKPNGIKVITKDMIPDILLPLPVKSVYGIGSKSSKRLNDIGIYAVEDLMRLSEEFLVEFFGKYGSEIYNRIRGIDNRVVEVTRERKSIGSESTFDIATKDIDILKSYLKEFSIEISDTLISKGLQGRTLTIKMKDEYFNQHTKSKTLNSYISNEDDIYNNGINILNEIELDNKLRLIGLTISNLISLEMEQLSLFD
jgi:DNA polymerase-4